MVNGCPPDPGRTPFAKAHSSSSEVVSALGGCGEIVPKTRTRTIVIGGLSPDAAWYPARAALVRHFEKMSRCRSPEHVALGQ